jgi:hypothetical protein
MQLGNPLVNDYVKNESRGKASMFIGLGYVMGETFSMACLFKMTRDLDATKAFAITAAVMAIMGLFIVLSIQEHVSSKTSQREEDDRKKASQLMRECWDEIKTDSSYVVAFFGAFQIRMIQVLLVVCVLLWVTNFVDAGYL